MTDISETTICLILDVCTVYCDILTNITDGDRLVLEAGHLPILNLPGHGPAGRVDQEVGELSHDVGQRHQGQEVDLGQDTLPHGECSYKSLYYPSTQLFQSHIT